MANSLAKTAALGFSVHTGWAAVAAVSGPLTAPTLLHRERIDIAPGAESGHVYHVAAELTGRAAQSHIDKCLKTSSKAALTALSATVRNLSLRGKVVASGVIANNAKLPDLLDSILASHMLIHSAEGDFYRRAILDASKALDLKPVVVKSKELADAASAALSLKPGTLPDHLATVGRTVGRPWARDEKDAYCAACVALAKAT
jgi:hypothetical protein